MPSIRVLVLCAILAAFAATAPAARPVARWDVVPDQRFAGVFEAGVCAFHIDGLRHPAGGRNRGAHSDPEGTSLSVSELPAEPLRDTAGA